MLTLYALPRVAHEKNIHVRYAFVPGSRCAATRGLLPYALLPLGKVVCRM